MRKRYFFWLTVSFCAGILIAETKWQYIAPFAAATAALAAIFFRSTRKLLLYVAFGLFLGFIVFTWRYGAYTERLALLENAPLSVEGRIIEVSIPAEEGEKPRLLVEGTIQSETLTVKDVAVYVYPEDAAEFTYGDTVRIYATGNTPSPPRNFGETDYRPYSMGKNLYGFLYPEENGIEKTGHRVSLFSPRDFAYKAKTFLAGRLSGRTSRETEAFLKALLTGDKSEMYRAEKDGLRVAGLSHIVAISGLHLGIIVGAVMALFGILKIRRRWFSVCVYLLLVWFFVLFTGASPSVLRAALMMTVFFFADFLRRDRDTVTALSFAAFFLCLVNPGMLFNIGFQFSCMSTLSIILFTGKIEAWLRFLPRFIRTGLSVSFAAFIGFAPLGARYFGVLSTVSVLANLLVCPLMAPLLVMGFLGGFLAPVPIVSDALFWILDVICHYILGVSGFLGRLPFAERTVQSPGFLFLCAYGVGAAALYLFGEKRRKQSAFFILLSFCLFAFQLFIHVYESRGATITFLSVGNGDCALVTLGETAILLDSGGSSYTDVAENTVLPYLRRMGIENIDAAFLTHYHTDHGAGFMTLLEEGVVQKMYLPYHADTEMKPALIRKARDAGTDVRFLGDGDAVFTDRVTVSALDSDTGNAENNGLVYIVEVFGLRALITGDIDKQGERRLVWRGAQLTADVLKVPHHGADTSGAEIFYDAVRPSVAVISSGQNGYGHPSEEVLSLLEKRQIPTYITERNGTVRIRVRENGKPHIQTLYSR